MRFWGGQINIYIINSIVLLGLGKIERKQPEMILFLLCPYGHS